MSAAADRPSRTYREEPSFRRTARGLGLRIRTLREEREWTLQHAAEQMSLDLKHLQKIESGSLNVTLVTLVRIADAFGRPVREIFPVPRRGVVAGAPR